MNLKRTAARVPLVRNFVSPGRPRSTEEQPTYVMRHAPGSYASPIPNLDEVRAAESQIWSCPDSLPGIDIRDQAQLDLVRELAGFYSDQPFQAEAQPGVRYYLANSWFAYPDGLMLHLVLRWARPRRYVEVGSGFSSAVTLDTNERFLDGALECTFIEPRPDRLNELLLEGDSGRNKIIAGPVQSVGTEVFEELDANDVLFIDSSHVSKVGSDVNRLVLDVLPRLKKGVLVHFHDIGWPFEYARQWIYQGRAWNEAYLVRAFLMCNPSFEILLFNHYLSIFHHEEVTTLLPLWGVEQGGSLWLRRS
jgi:hypothetical protein